MAQAATTYHQRIAQEKRSQIVTAATALFLELGYDRTSLARVAEESNVSRATLFKQFPTKSALFDAIVTESWRTHDDDESPEPGDPIKGLRLLGHRYVALLTSAHMANLFRIVIAEMPRFPELANSQFVQGKMPYFDSVRTYLHSEHAVGTMRVDDVDLASTQFLGMISNYVFWPRLLLPDWTVSTKRCEEVVEEAVRTMTSRYLIR